MFWQLWPLTFRVACKLYGEPKELAALSTLFTNTVKKRCPKFIVTEEPEAASRFDLVPGTDLAVTELEVSLLNPLRSDEWLRLVVRD